MTRALAFLVYEGFQMLDVTGPLAAFEIAARFQPGAYTLGIVSRSGGLVESSSGIALPSQALDAPTLQSVHTLLVSGGDGSRAARNDPELIRYIRSHRAQRRRIASICSGAYLLAEAGLLDGREATTHWSRTEDFAREYPKVRLQPDRIFCRDDDLWTSAGITAGIDMALAIIAEDLGEPVAQATARQLVVYFQRPGGQSQFSVLSEIPSKGGRFAGLLDRIRQDLCQTLDAQQLAGWAGMSERNFARRFRQDLGVTPAKFVERLRVEAAGSHLTAGKLRVEDIAIETGFGDSERMRRAFIRITGHPPQAIRRQQARG